MIIFSSIFPGQRGANIYSAPKSGSGPDLVANEPQGGGILLRCLSACFLDGLLARQPQGVFSIWKVTPFAPTGKLQLLSSVLSSWLQFSQMRRNVTLNCAAHCSRARQTRSPRPFGAPQAPTKQTNKQHWPGAQLISLNHLRALSALCTPQMGGVSCWVLIIIIHLGVPFFLRPVSHLIGELGARRLSSHRCTGVSSRARLASFFSLD